MNFSRNHIQPQNQPQNIEIENVHDWELNPPARDLQLDEDDPCLNLDEVGDEPVPFTPLDGIDINALPEPSINICDHKINWEKALVAFERIIDLSRSSDTSSGNSYEPHQISSLILSYVPNYAGIRFIGGYPCILFKVYEGLTILPLRVEWSDDVSVLLDRAIVAFIVFFIEEIYNDLHVHEMTVLTDNPDFPTRIWFSLKQDDGPFNEHPKFCDLARVSPLEFVYSDEYIWDEEPIILEPQSESPTDSGEAGPSVVTKETFNVDLVENRGELIGDPNFSVPISPKLDALTQPPETFENLTDRWNNLGTFQWSTGDARGKIIHTIDLPLDLLDILETNPALLPTGQYMFWKPNLSLRAQLNSTRFHAGGLIVGVQYYSGPNPKTGVRRIRHANQIWQLDYATLRAASSNVAELKIPFKSFLDALPIRGGSYGSSSYYATVYIGVIGGLAIGDGGSQTVNVTTQVKLACEEVPTEFYSQLSRIPILEPQGNTVSNIASSVLSIAKPVADVAGAFIPGASLVGEAIDIAGGLVENVVKPVEGLFSGMGRSFKASNMDKPSYPIDAPPLLQYPTASLSWGEGPTPGRSLRLNPATSTPHHPQTVPIGGDLLKIGDLASKWSYLDTFKINVSNPANTDLWSSPITPLASPPTDDGFLPTSLAGVASQFSYWSGQLEYKFIALKADPHSFRLRIASNPSDPIPASKLVDLPSDVVDFQEINEFTYVPPYFGPTHLTPTTYGSKACALGTVQVALENPLVSIESCSSEIEVIVLVRAHENFELAVPRSTPYTPNITTTTVDPPKPDVENNYVKVDGTVYLRLYSPDQYGFNLTAISPVITLVDQKYIVYGKPANKTVYLFSTKRSDLPDNTRSTNIYDGASSFVLIPNSLVIRSASIPSPAKNPLGNGEDYWYFRGPYANPIELTPREVKILMPQSNDERHENVIVDGPPSTARASQTQLILGETTTLRSSLRRYTPELSGDFVAEEDGVYEIAMDVNFGSLTARTAGTPVSNLTFNHDAFRFSKGGLSYIFDIRNTNNPNLKVRAMHIPGGLLNTYELRPNWRLAQLVTDPLCNMYANDIVATPNTSVPAHVPYYNFTNLIVNSYDPSTAGYGAVAAYGMGKLVFSSTLRTGDSFSWDIHRALGDDADMYCFQGWPICTQKIQPLQMNSIVKLRRNNLHALNLTPTQQLEPQSQTESQDFPKIPAASNEEQVISTFITEFSNSRRGRRALKTFLTQLSTLTPQDQTELSPGNVALLESLRQELVTCYKEHRPMMTLIPPFALHYLNPDDVAQARAEWHDDDNIQRRRVLNNIANTLAVNFSNFDAAPYYIATSQEGKTKSWTSALVGALSATTGIIPTSLKQNLGVISEIVKANAFYRVVKALKGTFSDLSNLNLVISCIQMILKATDLWVKSMALVMLLTHFGFLDSRQTGIAMLVNQLIYIVTPTRQTIHVMGLPSLVPQSDTVSSDTVAQWVAALMAGTSALCGLKNAKTWTGGVESFTRNLGSVGNGTHRLLTTSCKVVLDYILWLVGKEDPSTLAIAELKKVNVDAADWAKQVIQLVDPSRRGEVLSSPSLRKEVAELYEQGSVFMRVILEDKSRPESSGTFVSIWRSLVELFGETGEMPDSVRANMPPLCIWIDGEPGIGKSEVAKRVARDVALLLNITFDGDPFFVRTPRKYWDGYTCQPIIIFDDALQIRSPDLMSQFYSDWYGIMTNAPFSPEFSSISEKKKFVTPQIVIVCANSAFPKVEGISSPTSFYRRRDFLLRAEISAHIKSNYGNDISNASDIRIPLKELDAFNHLRFGQYSNPIDDKSRVTGTWTVTELINEMKPRIEHLVKIRTSSAEKNVEASRSLRAENIEAARGVLLKELEALDVANSIVSGLTKTYSDSTGERPSNLSEQNDTHDEHCGRMWNDGPKSSKLCMFACEGLARNGGLKCFCEVPDEHLQFAEYCTRHGSYVIRPKAKDPSLGLFASASNTGSPYVLGFFSNCKRETKKLKHDAVLTAAMKNVAPFGLGTTIPFPPFMNNTVVVPPEIDPQISEEVRQVSTWLTMKRNLRIWLQIGLKYLIPLALGFGVLFACKLFGIFGRIRDFISTSPTPDNQPPVSTSSVLTPIPQLASSGSVSTKGTPSVRRVLRAVTAQMSAEDTTRMILKNKVKLTVTHEDGVTKSTFGLGIFGRHIVLPYHIFNQHDRKPLLWQLTLFPRNCEPKVFDFDDPASFVFTQINGTDLALLEILSRRIPMFKDISKSLLRKEDLGKVNRTGMLVDVTKPEAMVVSLAIKPEEFLSQYNYKHGSQVVSMVGYSYPHERAGLCGSILIDSYHGWIIGMHVAGQAGTGYSTILSSAFFEGMVRPVVDVMEPELPTGGIVELEGNFLPLGKVLDAQATSLPLRTAIRKSVCHGVVSPPVRLPVKMITPGEPKPGLTKLKIALEKGGIPTRVWPQKHVDKAKAELIERIVTYCKPVTTSVGRRSFEEAICGISNVPYANPLKRTSSVGWPLCTLKKGTKKGDFVKLEDTADGLKIVGVAPELVDNYNRMHALRSRGIVPFSPFLNFLKDERLPNGKNPRLINGSSFSQTIDTRRYSLDFVSALQSNALDVGIGIGINVHGLQWSDLARRLLAVSGNVCCGDYSGFGPGLDTELVICAYEVINAWYEHYQTEDRERLPQDHAVRLTLAENLAFSCELSLDTMIKTLQGSPSGNDLTAVINSLVNHLMLMLVWQRVFDGTTIQEPSFLYRLCYPVVYGDDLIMSVHDSILDQFNNETLQQVFAAIGVKYTDADKSGNIRKFCPLSEASFLKCSFIDHPVRGFGTYLGALQKDVIEDIPNWIHACNDAEQASFENCVQACRFSYAWGYDYYRTLQIKFTEFWRSHGKSFPQESWEYLDSLFFGELRGVALPKTIDPENYSWA